MRNLITLACMAVAVFSIPAQAQQFELKGMRWGTKEADFKKANTKAKCGDTGTAKDLLPGELRSRLCTVSDFTVAGQATTEARFLFINGQLASMGFVLYEFSFHGLEDSIIAKHGRPTKTTYESRTWELKDARLWILKVDDKIAFDIDSPTALSHRERVRSQSAKRGAADL